MKYVIANYKMRCGIRESAALARGVLRGLRGAEAVPAIVVCPSFPALTEVRKVIAHTHVALGAQNVASVPSKALTGEVSAEQLKDAGCAFVLIGHAERRALLGETDAMVREKLVQTFAAGLTPILCVGADGAEAQVRAAFEGLAVPRGERIVVAYEPESAIGTGMPAAPRDVAAVHARLRSAVRAVMGAQREVVVVYGGSVDAANAYDFLREREIDGVLVGTASVKLEEFLAVIAAARSVVHAQGT